VAVVESAVGSEFRALGGIGGGVHVLAYDAVDAEAIVISRAGQLKTASSMGLPPLAGSGELSLLEALR
jgi:hypothetical protein